VKCTYGNHDTALAQKRFIIRHACGATWRRNLTSRSVSCFCVCSYSKLDRNSVVINKIFTLMLLVFCILSWYFCASLLQNVFHLTVGKSLFWFCFLIQYFYRQFSFDKILSYFLLRKDIMGPWIFSGLVWLNSCLWCSDEETCS